MYPRSFLCEEAKIKHRTSSKEQICEIGEGAIWESRFTSFYWIRLEIGSENRKKTLFNKKKLVT